MYIVKLISLLFLAVYLIIVGLHGMGVALAFIPATVVGFLAFVAGVLFLVWGIKSCCCSCSCSETCKHCEKHGGTP